MRSKAFYILLCIWAVLLSGCKKNTDVKAVTNVHYVQNCNFDPNSHITLPVTIGNQEFNFVLDTGTDGTIVDKRLRHLFGKTVKKDVSPETVNNIDLKLDIVEPAKSFSIGDKISFAGQVGVCDLSKFGPSMTEYDGIIGMYILKEFALLLDFENNRIVLTTDVNSLNLESFQGVVNINDNKGLCPYVTIDFNEMTEDFLVDTGVTHTGFTRMSYLRQEIYDILSKDREQYPVKNTIDGPIVGKAMEIDNPKLGNIKYSKLTFYRGNISLLGMPFLSIHSRVAFDFKERKMYLCP